MILRTALTLLLIFSMAIAQENLLAPVALIRSDNDMGVAFIVGERGDELYLLSAAHVITDVSDINIEFRGFGPQKGRNFNSDVDLDIATFSCRRPPGFSPLFYSFATGAVKAEEPVIIIGHPLGNKWDINKINRVKESTYGISPGRFTVYPTGIGPGSSGGPVLNQQGQLLGLITDIDMIKGICVQSEVLTRACQEWGVPVKKPKPGSITDPFAGKMVFIKGGSFLMGSTKNSKESPLHSVSLNDYYLGETEVTVGQYLIFCEETNTNWPAWLEKGNDYNVKTGTSFYYRELGAALFDDDHPVIGISWNNARAYCKWLAEKTGDKYRLPTEAEWEYAAGGGKGNRTEWAGTNTKENLGDYGWYSDNGDRMTHPAAQKEPNQLGLYDMSGNVWEWCSDFYGEYSSGEQTNPRGPSGGSDRIYRGGSWGRSLDDCRIAKRGYSNPTVRISHLGFRIARDL